MKRLLRWFFVEEENIRVQKRYLTVPNAITMLGIAGVAIYAWMFAAEINTRWIPWVVVLIGASDMLDGAAARLLDQHTHFGKIIDPLRDRLLVAAVVANMLKAETSFAAAILVAGLLVVELFIVAARAAARARLGDRLKTHSLAKGRVLVHLVVSGVFIVKTYWPAVWSSHAPAFIAGITVTHVLVIMLAASIVAAGIYGRKALP